MNKHWLPFGRIIILPNLVWTSVGLAVLCLFGCETYQHKNIKVGQPESVAIDIKERYMDSKSVIQRLAKLDPELQLDSLLKLAEILENFGVEVGLDYAQEAHRLAIERGQDLSEAISMYYIVNFKEDQSFLGEKLEDVKVDAKLSRHLFQKRKRNDWMIDVNWLIARIYYKQVKYDSAFLYINESLALIDQIALPENQAKNLQGKLYFLLANIYSTFDTLNASHYYNQSLSLYNTTNNIPAINKLKVGMGYYYLYDLKNFEKADLVFNESLNYALSVKDFKLLSNIYQGLGSLNLEQFKRNRNIEKATILKGTRNIKRTRYNQYLDKALANLRAQLKYLNGHFYYTYQLIGYTFAAYSDFDDPENTGFPRPEDRKYYLDSAIINYKIAVDFAQKDGSIDIMKSIGNSLSAFCEAREKEIGLNCDSLLGNSLQVFLNNNYAGIVTNISENLDFAEQKNRKFIKREQEIIHEQRVFRQQVISGVGLTFSALFFLILLQRAQQKRLIAKMEALRAQINPHFISNSLNAIESLVNLNQKEAASKYLVHFSRLSRRILNNSREGTVTLSEELETLEHFLALEQLRFRDKLHFDIEIQEGLNPKLIYVPGMIMQPYVENAIWHGIKPKTEPGLLKIIIEKDNKHLRCIIEDNGIGREKSKALKANSVLKNKSHGMQISKERLEAIGKMKGAKVSIIDLKNQDGIAMGTRVILRFPLKFKK